MVKQVIVIRKDLKMRRGKEITQGSHVSKKFLLERPTARTVAEEHWLETCNQKTVCCRVSSEQELNDLYDMAIKAGIQAHKQIDAGKTEFNGVPTLTCIAIGPEYEDIINPITGQLELY
jgi:PTH2 family peptidyl-tRNA hydrolase